MRRALIVAWSPAAVLVAALVASTLAGIVGHRALTRMADAQLEVAGAYVAHHFQSMLVSRLRALESVAAIDAQSDLGAERERQRHAMIDSLVRLHPEFVWVGFAEVPGTVTAAYRDLLEGADVSGRDWWSAALKGPYLGGVHEVALPASALARDARPGATRADPPRLLDVAVPLRRADGEPYGVLAAHLDAGWVVAVRDEMAVVAEPLADVDVAVLQRDGSTLSGRRVRLGPQIGAGPGGIRDGAIDDRPRTFGVRPIDGDVVVSRLGWQVAVGRDPALHEAPARRFLGWSIAGGAVVGAIGAIAVGLAAAARARRPIA
jgi:diguanylate cyclase